MSSVWILSGLLVVLGMAFYGLSRYVFSFARRAEAGFDNLSGRIAALERLDFPPSREYPKDPLKKVVRRLVPSPLSGCLSILVASR